MSGDCDLCGSYDHVETGCDAWEDPAACGHTKAAKYGAPMRDEYRRLGASGDEAGMFVRFEPGFGLNVHVGYRYRAGPHAANPSSFIETEFPLGIDGWERLCELADEWRALPALCPAPIPTNESRSA